jgi:hypothetical protein
VFVIPSSLIKNLVMRTSVDKNEVNMGFMPLAYPLLV